tara:strand:- start:332 stop:511 length:180 start_codon:yes stop_codon:yes gene_type:complete
MTKEELLKRKADIEKDLVSLVATHTALTGQLNECNFWLGEMDKAVELADKATEEVAACA